MNFCFLFSAGYFPSHKVFTVATIKSALEIGENTNVGNLLHVGLGIFAVKFDIIAKKTFQSNFDLEAKSQRSTFTSSLLKVCLITPSF